MTGKATEIYKYLEPLYNDYRKLAYRGINGWELIRMDEFIDILLCNELACDVALPFLPKRLLLEDSGVMEPRKSILEDEIDDTDEDEEKETDKFIKEKKKKKDSLTPIISSGESESTKNVTTPVGESEVEISSTQLKNQEKIEQMKNFISQETQAKELKEIRDSSSEKIIQRDQEMDSRAKEVTTRQPTGEDRNRNDNERTKDRSRDRKDRDRSRDRKKSSEWRDRSPQRRKSRSRERGGRSSRDDDRRRDLSLDRESRRDRSRDKDRRRERSRENDRRRDRSRENDRRRGRSRDRDRGRYSRRSPSTSSRSPSSSRSRSRNNRKQNSYQRSDSPKKYQSSAPSAPSVYAPPPFPSREAERDDDFEKILDKDSEATINPYKFKYTAKKFDKMFGKKTKASATTAPNAGTIPIPASKSSSHAAEEGSVEYWNQLRESLGIKKLK